MVFTRQVKCVLQQPASYNTQNSTLNRARTKLKIAQGLKLQRPQTAPSLRVVGAVGVVGVMGHIFEVALF